IMTAKCSSLDQITGLQKGGDDYLVKPFDVEELFMRVRTLVRRSMTMLALKELKTLTIVDMVIHFSSYQLLHPDGTVTLLSQEETMLLKLLSERRNEAVSREQILETVWNYDVYPSTRTIDNFILTFRKYFEPDQKHPIYFHSIRGV